MPHSWHDADIRRLADLLVRQCPYQGDVCLAPETAIAYAAQGFDASPNERQVIDGHLAECMACRHEVEQLRLAGAEFERRQDELWKRLTAATSAEDDVHADATTLYLLTRGITSMPMGEPVARLSAHVGRCAECATAVSALAVPALPREVAGREAALLLVASLAAVASRVRHGRIQRGLRSADVDHVDALVLDSAGTPARDAGGTLRRVPFGIRRAEIDPQGHLVLSLSTAEPEYWARPGKRHVVKALVTAGGVAVQLPPWPVSASGGLTISTSLGDVPTVRWITQRSLALVIQPDILKGGAS